ncbi:hypothetical protein [Bosea sp. (in: a-proteobacteria)]|uniref:glucosamine inositolphosphorylceramide transferase family protein n=1 Tax=Bosea sp. (in: a-proteobacteria) TaxID=1871050 RepID=UPI00260D07B7|nr:hypothetical protein [Bosea sp. (in: a-proteobacteria)]MCO5090849.1 hypothetical protein [Bosea sp. (in: a-proteobacteria)]
MSAILIIGQAAAARRWEHELVARLVAAGHVVSIRHAPGTGSGASGLDTILRIESRRFGSSLAALAQPLPAAERGTADLIVDLTGSAAGQAAPVLKLDFCGHANPAAGLGAMLASAAPFELGARLDGVLVAQARPMIGDRLWLSRACDDWLAGAVSLVMHCVARFGAGKLAALPDAAPPSPRSGGFLRHYPAFFWRGAVERARQKLRRGRRPFYWQVAYRLIEGPGIAETGRFDGAAFTLLPDDGERFYADPFVIERAGRHYLFVEEFPYAGGRGVISVAELDGNGAFGVPRKVLEEAHHLSYPQVFAQGGEVFMIPESAAARELVLYRAERFPDRWVRDTVLIADRDLNDATLVEAGGRFWLVGTERHGHGSASDTMAVYGAPALRGPWSAHPLNPIAIDHSATRPGGAFIRGETGLMLPVQAGGRAYGGGLGLMSCERLDATDVRFSPPRPVDPGPAWAGWGVHTLNRAGRVEVVDRGPL